FIPQLEFVQLADQHRALVQLGVLAQARRHEETAAAVQLQIHRIADQQTLQAAALFAQGRQFAQLGLDECPLGQGIDAQTGVDGIDSDDELAGTTRNELVTIPARHRESPFGVETDGVSSAKHAALPLKLAIPAHEDPLSATS